MQEKKNRSKNFLPATYERILQKLSLFKWQRSASGKPLLTTFQTISFESASYELCYKLQTFCSSWNHLILTVKKCASKRNFFFLLSFLWVNFWGEKTSMCLIPTSVATLTAPGIYVLGISSFHSWTGVLLMVWRLWKSPGLHSL